MSSFNKVILMGNMVRDPAIKFLPSQMAVCEFGLATNRRYKTSAGEERDDVCFVDCSAFGKTGEVINQHFKKGKPILVEGRLTYSSWDDKNGGGKRSKLTVTVDRFEFVGGPRDDADGDDDQRPRHPISNRPIRQGGGQRPQPPQDESPPFGDESHFKEDSIPFAWSGRDTQPV